MARVLLQRPMRTPFGRFDRSVDGVPTDIPDGIINSLRRREMQAAKKRKKEDPDFDFDPDAITGLPSDAVVVGPDYKTPEQTRQEAEYADDLGGEMSAAEQEARIHEEVERRLAAMAADKASDANADDGEGTDETDEGDDILDESVANIVPKLADMGLEELEDLLEREQAGKTRSSLVAEIEAAIEDCRQEG